ncbi:MAG: cadherin-like domain-containing protein, partial [Gammaproteobacteria bacterium]|nr:cadherin-like domain-containing protein [Gammaproteobacteria bacterium]
ALAEGSGQVGMNQPLECMVGGYDFNNIFYVDILTTGEVINVSLAALENVYRYLDYDLWQMVVITYTPGSFSIYDPSGNPRVLDEPTGQVSETDPFTAPITTAYQFVTDEVGAWSIVLANSWYISGTPVADYYVDYARFDISVTPTTTVDPDPRVAAGRLWAYEWGFNAGSYTEISDADYYVLVQGGRAGFDYVWQLDLNDFAGYRYGLVANDLGVDAPYSGYSISRTSSLPSGWAPATVTPKFPIYLGYPAVAESPPTLPPMISSLRFIDDAGIDATISPTPTTPGVQDSGYFSFTSDITGTYGIVIDTNQDSAFGAGDRLLLGNAAMGLNGAQWDGKDPIGNVVSPGTYAAQVQLRTGEYHFIGDDVETSGGDEDGLTIRQAFSDGTFTDTLAYWDDATYLGGTTTLPDGALSNTSAGHHTWGDYTETSFGDGRYIDTYVYGLITLAETQAVVASDDDQVFSPELDLDADDSSGSAAADYETTFCKSCDAVPIADEDTSISDANSANMARAEATLTTPQAGDVLTVTGALPAGISLDGASTATKIILTGSATRADYEAAIELICFNNPSATADTTQRTVTVVVNDGTSNSNTAISTIYFVNSAPSANAGDDQSVIVDTVATLDGSASSDADNDALTYGWTQTGGTAVSFTSNLSVTTFTAPSSTGTLTFTLTVTDSHGLADATPDEVVVTVTLSNQAPTAVDDTVTTVAGQAITISVLANDTDPDGDTLSVSDVTQGTNGSVGNNGDSVTYTPTGSFIGTDTFTYVASDGSLTDTA